jgi:hypothetical protein
MPSTYAAPSTVSVRPVPDGVMAFRLRDLERRQVVLKNICRSIAAMTFVAATSLPATAQVEMRVDVPLPGLEIRVGHRAPPRLQREHRPPRPGRDSLWIRGFWHWQGNDWDWVPGRWERPSHRGARWVKPRYAREGSAWHYEPGHWSNQRLIEGDDYRRWKSEKHRNRGHDGDRDRDRDHR